MNLISKLILILLAPLLRCVRPNGVPNKGAYVQQLIREEMVRLNLLYKEQGARENGYDVAERYLQNLRTFDLHPYDSGSEDVTIEELYEGLLQTVDDFDMSDGARYSLDRGRRTARLTHRISDYASRSVYR